MAENRLSIGNISLPEPKTDQELDMKIALEQFIQVVRDNVDYLLKPRIVTVTGAYTATDLDHTILADASGGVITVTLPEASTVSGLLLNIKKIDSSGNAITVDGNSSEEIDGSTTQSLSSQYDSIAIHCDGTNWNIVSNK